jgi:hypothetical protein
MRAADAAIEVIDQPIVVPPVPPLPEAPTLPVIPEEMPPEIPRPPVDVHRSTPNSVR